MILKLVSISILLCFSFSFSFFYSNFPLLFTFVLVLQSLFTRLSSCIIFITLFVLLDVTRSREIGGVLTLYTVVTSWRSLRSTVSLQYSDFKDYHTALETALKDQPALLNNIPKLPDPKLFTASALSLDAIGKLLYIIL